MDFNLLSYWHCSPILEDPGILGKAETPLPSLKILKMIKNRTLPSYLE